MRGRTLIALALAMALACSALGACSSGASSSQSPASASETASHEDRHEVVHAHDGTIVVTLEYDTSLLEGVAQAEGKMPFTGTQEFELSEDATVYDLLYQSGVKIDGTSTFISGLNGIGENMAGSATGWMYMVDGEPPAYPANEYVLHDGDSVVWYYGSWN